jgi:hypothetical protein
VPSQLNAGKLIVPGDAEGTLDKFCRRLGTFTIHIANTPEPGDSERQRWKNGGLLMDKISEMSESGPFIYIAGSRPTIFSGCTMFGCAACYAALHMPHPYFTCEDAQVIKDMNRHIVNFLWKPHEQNKLGITPETPSAAYMCTAETMHPGCKTAC